MKNSIIVASVVFLLFSCNRYINTSQIESIYPKAVKSTELFPFQVLHAENVYERYVLVDQYAYLSNNDTIRIENGHLILVHYSGKFVEFTQDTSVIINKLDQSIVIGNSFSETIIKYRPKITGFLGKVIQYDGAKGVSTICGPISYIEVDGLNQREELASDICLSWNFDQSKMTSFDVDIKNIYDESVYRISTLESNLTIDITDSLSRFEHNLMIVEVLDSSKEYSSGEIGIYLVDSLNSYIPKRCKASSSTDFLEMAFYHYTKNENSEALEMVNNARDADAGDIPFYKSGLSAWR